MDVQLTRNLGALSMDVLETSIPETPHVYTRSSLWRVRQVVTFNEFSRCFRLVSSNVKEYPILAAVLQYEKSLPLVKLASHILAWHALLFRVFQPGSLTRAEASNLTNRDAIARLPENEQKHAESVMHNFCHAFNAVITQPGNLRECADNVFVDTATGKIDLDMTRGASGSFKSMSPETSLSFSLPSSLKDGNEFVDPRALCTLFILEKLKVIMFVCLFFYYHYYYCLLLVPVILIVHNVFFLQTIQETVVEALLTATSPSSEGADELLSQKASSSSSTSGRIQKRLNSGNSVGNGLPMTSSNQQAANQHKIPLTSYLTPVTLISRRLLSYDRDIHLMPSIYAYYKQVCSSFFSALLPSVILC